MITKSIIVTLVIVALAVPVVNVSASSKPEIVPPVITGSGSGSMCPDGYSRTEDGENCKLRDVQCDEDPDDSLCNGERGREGLIFCDVQYQEEGSKSSCYDRNDNPEQYCLMHPGDPWDFSTICSWFPTLEIFLIWFLLLGPFLSYTLILPLRCFH